MLMLNNQTFKITFQNKSIIESMSQHANYRLEFKIIKLLIVIMTLCLEIMPLCLGQKHTCNQ